VNPNGKRISIIIVVWNARAYVLECLETLFSYAHGLPLEVIAVDNDSKDGAPEAIAERFQQVRLIRNGQNLGFAKANNIGIRASTGEYLCLVNSDVSFVEDCLSPMVDFMEANPGIGIVGPQMLVPPAKDVARSTMRFPTIWNTLTRYMGMDVLLPNSKLSGALLNSDFDHRATRDVEVLNGWFWMIRRSALSTVGLLDEQFFMYGEDVDWCQRFHKAGQRVVFFAGAKALHYGGASAAGSPLFFSVEKERANLQLFRKHYGGLSAAVFWAISLCGNFVRALGFGVICLFRPTVRKQAGPKFQRSIACLRWLIRNAV